MQSVQLTLDIYRVKYASSLVYRSEIALILVLVHKHSKPKRICSWSFYFSDSKSSKLNETKSRDQYFFLYTKISENTYSEKYSILTFSYIIFCKRMFQMY